MTVVTLTTDFGTNDYEAGVLKGVIWKIAPQVHIADLSHEIIPHQVIQAALVLWRAAPYFPPGTIHVAVVDPGVGTRRRAIAARIGSSYFVGPDNGLLSLLLDRAEENNQDIRIVSLDRSEYWLPEVSNVFHGRDIFAPVAAHLAMGVGLGDLGTPITDPVRLEISRPISTPRGYLGQVIYVDHFGNLTTNLHALHLRAAKEVNVRIKNMEIMGLVSTFGEKPAGTIVALLDSSGLLAISVVNGSAAQYLQAGVGEKIEIIIDE